MFSSTTQLALSGFLAFGLSTAAATPALLPRVPPTSGMNVCTVTPTFGQYLYCNYGTTTFGRPATPISTEAVASLAACRDSCLVNKVCQGFGYKTSTKTCLQFKTPIAAQKPGKQSQRAPIHYFGRKCYDATYYNNQALLNTGFETDSLRPWTAQLIPNSPNSAVNVVSGGDNSAFSVQLSVDNTGAANGDPDLQTFVNQNTSSLCAGVGYGFLYSLNPVSAVTDSSNFCNGNLHLWLNDPNGNTIYDHAFGLFDDHLDDGGNDVPNGNWYDVGIPFTPTVSGVHTVQIQVESCAGGAATVRMDNVHVQA